MGKEQNATNRYLDRLAALHGLRSDYAIAAFLGVTRQHVSHWRRCKVQFSDDQAFIVAERLSIDPVEILAAIGSERAKEESTRAGWREIFRRVTHDAAPIAFVIVAISAAMLVGNVPGGSALNPHHVEVSSALPELDARPGLNIMSSVPGADSRGAPHPVVRAVSHIPIALFVVFLLLRASTRNPHRYGVSSFVP